MFDAVNKIDKFCCLAEASNYLQSFDSFWPFSLNSWRSVHISDEMKSYMRKVKNVSEFIEPHDKMLIGLELY